MQTSRSLPCSRPRIGVPVRLTSSSDPDPRVAEANALFEYIVELLREGGGEPVLLDASGHRRRRRSPRRWRPSTASCFPAAATSTPASTASCAVTSATTSALPRTRWTLAVARQAIDAGLPVFGICRGHQLLNVLYGGTLIQDMAPGTVAHREPAPVHGAGPWAWHEVAVQAGSKVAALYGGGSGAVTVKIASGHHQAVARVAGALRVTAVAEDGTVEALEDPERWVASVQWHPEALELPAGERLAPFRAFVEVCRNRP